MKSRVYVHEKRIVDNDGLHGMVEWSGRIGLKAGYHPVRVEWFHTSDGCGLEVHWSGPGFVQQSIPHSVLLRI